MRNLDIIAQELFNKIRGRFPSVTIGNSEGKVTNVPKEARYYDFDFKEGDDVRLLIRKGAFEKGTWEFTKDVFRIYMYDVQRPDKKSTSQVAKYFVMDSDGEPLTSMDSETGQKEPSYYMGYQLLLANDIEDSPNYKEQKVKQQAAQTEKKEKAAKVSRKLAKEGLDDAAPVKLRRGKRSGRKDPEKILNRNIKVKRFIRSDGDTEPLTAVAERRMVSPSPVNRTPR